MNTHIQGAPLEFDAESRRGKVIYGCVLLAVGVVCVALAPTYGFWPGFVAFFALLGGGSVVVAAMKTTNAKGSCPSCGGLISDVELDRPSVACTHCGAYAIVDQRRLVRTPDDHVADHPTYRIVLEPGSPLPVQDVCVGCANHATHAIQRELEKTEIWVPGVGKTYRKWTIAVPLCATHAQTDPRGRIIAGHPTMSGDFEVASYRYWRVATGRG